MLTASWVERLWPELGLQGVSQVWDDRPAWYFWLSGAPGAYELALAQVQPREPNAPQAASAIFEIKFYPRAGAPVLETFSPQEQSLVRSAVFDDTDTPVFEARAELDPELFRIAVMEATFDQQAQWALFTLEGLDICRTRQGPGRNGDDPEEGRVVRRAPGWDLSLVLFQKLLGCYAFYSKQPPSRVLLGAEPGFDLLINSQGGMDSRPAPDNRLSSLSVLFSPDPAHPPREPLGLMNQDASNNPLGIQLDRTFTCGHYHPSQDPGVEARVLDPLWWSLARAQYKSNLSSACGCEH